MAGQAVLTIDSLPAAALDAASQFHRDWTGQVRRQVDQGADAVAVVMPPAPVDHTDWRRAAARDLARALAPVRVNVLSGADEVGISAMLTYLANAPGVTGHYLPLHGD
ncbi:MAG: Rossmann fold domain-containing protein [Sphingomonadaceae bacterium]